MYVDPNAPIPDVQSTRPSSAIALGKAGYGLNDIIEAANSGALRVDEAVGAATIQAIDTVRAELDSLRRLTMMGSRTRLGGGYAELIDRFNVGWTVEGAGSAVEVMTKFGDQLELLREAVARSMETYRSSDESGVRHLGQAEGAR